MRHRCRANLLDGQVVRRLLQYISQLQHQRCRIDLDQPSIVTHKPTNKGLSGQTLPVAAFQRFHLPRAQLEGVGDIPKLQAPSLSCQAKLLANRCYRRCDAVGTDSIVHIDLLTHSKLPFRNS